ncbi:MAG: response regulator, partial [Nitrospirota bacterium]
MISVLLVDPSQIIRAGIRTFLSQSTDIRLLEEAPRGTHVIEVVARRKPTVVLMETSLLEGSSVPISQAIRQSSHTSRVLFFSAFVDQAALRATALGEAEGYLLKEADADEVIRAVRIVAEGHTYLDPR